MRIGILYFNSKRQPLNLAVAMAVAQFNAASHTKGYKPAEIRLHPAEMPAAEDLALLTIDLTIHPDRDVRPGHIRITTKDVSPEEEFEADKADFNRQVLAHSSVASGVNPV